MPRPKLPRKSTNVDMTAMCDVAFLLLSFFILTTKFKPAEAVEITTPNSVSSKPAPEKDFVLVSITGDGKVFLTMDQEDKKRLVLEELNTRRNLGLTPDEINKGVKAPLFGSSFSQLKSALQLPADKMTGATLPGIPARDSTSSEITDWIRAVAVAYMGTRNMNLLLKGDLNSKYPAFRNVIEAFKKNDFLKFQMVTNPENVPEGTELFRKNISGEMKEE